MVADIRDKRRGVMIMPPVRPMASPAIAAKQTKSAQPKASNVWELGAKMAAEGAQGESQPEGEGGFGRGLGFLINNPVTQGLLKPLEVLDYGRRGSILGTEYAARALPQELETALAAVGVGIPIALVDESKSRADERSAWEKFRDPTYGWGQVGQTTGNKWVDRGIGLAGDVALDPLTYLTFGAAPLVKGAPTVGRASRFSRMGEAADALRAADRLDEPAIQMLRRVGERGYGAADEEMLQLLGLQRSGARFGVPFTNKVTPPIPGTKTVARGINTATGAFRGAFNRSDKAQRLIRAPKELETATEVLTRASRGNNDEFLAALTDVQWNNIARTGSGFFKGMASQELRQRSEAIRNELNDKFAGNLDEYLRVTELDPTQATELNALGARMREIAAERGVEIPELEGMGYLPHVLSPEFRELLHEGSDKAKKFMSQTGIVMNDTLRESGFLQKRALRPDPGSTLKIELGPHVVEIKTGSIPEINAKVKELFPELKATPLETDPMTMFERYITGTATDIGNREARNVLGARNNPFVRLRSDPRFEPKLAARDEAQEALNRIERQIQAEGESPSLLRRRRAAAERLDQAEKEMQAALHRVYRGSRKPFEDDEVFKATLNQDATAEANEQIFKQAASTSDTERQAAETIRMGDDEHVGLIDELSALRNEIRAPMSARARRIPRRIQELDDRIADVVKEGRSQAYQKRRVRELARQTMSEIRPEIAALSKEIRALPRRLRQAAGEEQLAYIRSMSERLNSLRNEGEELLKYFETGLNDEIDEITRGLREAQQKLDEALGYYTRQVPDLGPEELVQRAEAQTPGPVPGQIIQEHWGPSPFETAGSRPLPRDPSAAELEATSLQPPPEAAGAASKNFAAQQAADEARAEVRRLELILDRPNEINRARIEAAERLKAAAQDEPITPRDVTEQQAAIKHYQDQLKRLNEELPKAKARIRQEGIKAKLTRAKAKRERLSRKLVGTPHPRLPYIKPTEPDAIQALRRQVEMEELSMDRGRLEMLRTERERLRNAPETAETIKRVRAIEAQLPVTENELMRALRGEGVVGHIGSEAEREIASRVTSMEARRAQLEQALKEIPEDVRREVLAIQEIQDELKRYANELATEQGRLLAERQQLRAAVEASPTRAQERTGAASRASTRDLNARSPELIETQPLNRVINEIEQMARMNPGATDESLNVIEAQLQMYRRQLEQAAQHDLKANQAMDVAAAAKDQSFVKVYTAMLRDGWESIPGQDDVFVRSELRRMMRNAEQIQAQPGLFGSTIQALTNFFKTYATLSPGFHVRNALSATFMNTTDGVALRNQLAGVHQWRDFVRAKDPLEFYNNLTPQWRQAFDSVFATGAGGRFFESGVAEATAIGRTQLKEGIFRNRATILSQRAGQRVEGSVRLGMAFDTLKNGGSVEDAINRITRVHFDYSQVSKFDENMKRLIPFWTFMSRNLPLQFSQMWMKPKVYNWYKSFVRNVAVESPEFTPEYITEGGGFNTGAVTPEVNIPGLGAAPGMPIFANPDFSQNRYEGDVERLTGALSGENWSQILSDFNPFLTAPIEYATDTDLFTGRRYAPDDWRRASGATDLAMLPLLAATGQTRRGSDGEIYYQEKGVDAFRSMIPILDRVSRLAPQSAGGEASDRQLESVLRFLGVPVRTISEDQMTNERRARVFDAREQQRLRRVLAGG